MQNEPPAELVEIIAAITLAPFMEGGRGFDRMPADRIALRKWSREGMCSTNDATQDDALEAASAVLAVVIPQIEARVADWLENDATQTEQEAARIVANTTGNPRKNAAEWEMLVSLKRGIAAAIRRGDYRSKS